MLQQLGERGEAVIRGVPGISSVYAERVVGGSYLNIKIRRDEFDRDPKQYAK